jgi:predicted  nucleic acid-binding Zn-ribbon protein
MNTQVTSLDTPLAVQIPDVVSMSNNQGAMMRSLSTAEVLFSKTRYLPNLHDRYKRLNGIVSTERQRLRGACAKMAIDIEFSIGKLREYDQESRETTEQDHLDELQAARQRTLSGNLTALNGEAIKLQDTLRKLNQSIDRNATEDFRKSLQQDIASVTVRLDAAKTQLTSLTEARRVASEAIAALESKGFAEIAKDTLLTAEKVIALGLQPPQIAVITLAVEQLKETLEFATASINYLGLVKQRDSLRGRIDALNEQLLPLEKEKLDLSQRLELIACFHAMDDQRSAYAQQYQKIVQTVDSFVALNTSATTEDQQATRRFISSGLQMVSYLQLIR